MKKVILVILDGIGINNGIEGNAIKKAKTPNLDKLMTMYPCAELEASGEAIGLAKKQCGDSEVSHMIIGSGRIVEQPLSIINNKIKSKEFFANEELDKVMNHVNKNNSTLHLIGLLSTAEINSSVNHFYATLAMAKLKGVKKVCFHFITDGRDSGIKSAKKTIADFMKKVEKLELGEIATISGRYYAMDRDENPERTKKVYDTMVYGMGNIFSSFENCLEEHYSRNINDEYINPSIINKFKPISNNDGIIFINFRPEKIDQLIESITNPNFKLFQTKKLENIKVSSLFKLNDNIPYAYKLHDLKDTFGSYIDGLEFTQSRIAESEKFEHVTTYFDGGKEFTSNNCAKFCIPSPVSKNYAEHPEMSIGEVTQTAFNEIENDRDFILVNFSNADSIAHTGNFEATKSAIEICDFCLGKLVEKAKDYFYDVVITSDHGFVEQLLDKNGEILTKHTTNKVPFIVCNENYKLKTDGTIADIIPTIIDVYEIKKPDTMTGNSLIIKDEQ